MQKYNRYKDSERQATNAYLFYWKLPHKLFHKKIEHKSNYN